VVTIGAIKGGVRENIIPDTAVMIGTIRAFDEGMREDIHVVDRWRLLGTVQDDAGLQTLLAAEPLGGMVALRRKSLALTQLTTRTHYPGLHRIELLVNGHAYPLGVFHITAG